MTVIPEVCWYCLHLWYEYDKQTSWLNRFLNSYSEPSKGERWERFQTLTFYHKIRINVFWKDEWFWSPKYTPMLYTQQKSFTDSDESTEARIEWNSDWLLFYQTFCIIITSNHTSVHDNSIEQQQMSVLTFPDEHSFSRVIYQQKCVISG